MGKSVEDYIGQPYSYEVSWIAPFRIWKAICREFPGIYATDIDCTQAVSLLQSELRNEIQSYLDLGLVPPAPRSI